MLEKIAQFTGFSDGDVALQRSKEQNRKNLFSLERRPIKTEWKSYQKHQEIIELAQELGYCMDEKFIAEFIRKYQLPKGVLPYVRNKIGYWKHKENLGRLLRSTGLRRERKL